MNSFHGSCTLLADEMETQKASGRSPSTARKKLRNPQKRHCEPLSSRPPMKVHLVKKS